MKNSLFLFVLLASFTYKLYAQNEILPAQYYQTISMLNPALTGSQGILDFKTGYNRRQNGFNNSPATAYFNGEGMIKSGKASWNRLRKRMIFWDGHKRTDMINQHKIGLGAFYLGTQQGAFRQFRTGINTSIHIPLTGKITISLGLSPQLLNRQIDLSQITIRDPVNDQTYQSLVQNGASNTHFDITSGLAVFTQSSYFAYGTGRLINTQISGSEDFGADTNDVMTHHFIGSYTFQLNPDLELIPHTFVRMDRSFPTFYDITIRGRYQKNVWAGASYRSDDTFIGSFGFMMTNGIKFGYSYQLQTGILNDFNSGSHELIMGVSFD